MWIVWDNYEGMVCITDDYDEALKEYENHKQVQEDYVNENGEFDSDERVVLAKIQRDFYSYDTKESAVKYGSDGKELESNETCWDWKEDVYEVPHGKA